MKVYKIFGPPGTGKTTELLKLLEEELKTYSPEEIAYVSFTKEGSEQGRSRAMSAFSYQSERFPHFRTLHSAAFRALNLRRSTVMDKQDYRVLSDKLGMSFTGHYTEDLRHDDDMYLFYDEIQRNNPKTAQVYWKYLDADKLKYVRKQYAAFKRVFGLMDFTDMIKVFVDMKKALPVKVAFVDEAQDLTTLQWSMVWTAFADCDKVYIAGDDDQAIYQWSGADVEYFLSIPGEQTVLRHSYRLPDKVLKFAKRISSQIAVRVDKDYEGRGTTGGVFFHNSIETVPISDKRRWMFLVRNHAFMGEIETALRNHGLVYVLSGTPSITKEELILIELYEKVRKTRMMTQEEEVKLNRHLKKKYSLEFPWYDSFKWPEDKIMYVRDVIKNKTDISVRNIRVNTIHTSKGAEADNVVLLLDVTKSVANNIAENPDSEHRAFYVGATRAKTHLHIVHGTTKYAYPIF